MHRVAIKWRPDELSAARPKERITRSEWCRRNLVLTEKSAIRGPYDLKYTPYWYWPTDELLSDIDLEILVICASAQIGKSYFTYGFCLHGVDQEKRSSLIVLADQGTAEKVAEERLGPLADGSESLSKYKKKFTREGLQFLHGAGIAIAWASSVPKLATFEYPYIILDEVDKPGYSLCSDEADAISLAIERTETFFNRKIVIISTPSIESGNIWTHLNNCDAVYDVHVPCPHCGQSQPLRWDLERSYGFESGFYRADDGTMHKLGQVTWQGGRKATREQIAAAGYECGECGELWSTVEKNKAIDQGKWIARQKIDFKPRKVGLHIWRIYSKLGKSGDIPKLVGDWISAVNSGESKKIQGFVNSTLAGPYKIKTQERKEASVYALKDDRPRGLVPSAGILGLTCGADTQDNGFYYVIRAWGNPVGGKLESWLVREGFVETSEALEKIIRGKFQDAENRDYIVSMALVDAMGHRTSEVYSWLKDKPDIKPCKGEQRMATPYSVSIIEYYPNSTRTIPGGLKLYRLNSNYYKDALFTKIGIPPGDPGGFHIHSEIGEDYAKQMVAEFRNDQGFWDCPQGRPNHYWDSENLALAAAEILGIQHWGQQQPVAQQAQSGSAYREPGSVATPSAHSRINEAIRNRLINPYTRGR